MATLPAITGFVVTRRNFGERNFLGVKRNSAKLGVRVVHIFVVAAREFDADEAVAFFNLDADDAAFARIGVFAEVRFLHDADFCGHEQKLFLGEFLDADNPKDTLKKFCVGSQEGWEAVFLR